jgi:BASS family bile acid:Na+ symporter
MNNSSAGAVVAATRLPGNPAVLLPILAYSLLQKVLASSVGALVRKAPFGDEGSAGAAAVPTAPKEPLGFRRL